jgi:hypothetical protein
MVASKSNEDGWFVRGGGRGADEALTAEAEEPEEDELLESAATLPMPREGTDDPPCWLRCVSRRDEREEAPKTLVRPVVRGLGFFQGT